MEEQWAGHPVRKEPADSIEVLARKIQDDQIDN